MKTTLITLFVFVLIGNLFAQDRGEAIILETKTGKIEGTLLCPPAVKKMPVVLIIAGSGPTDRNGNNPMMTNNSLKMLAEGLFEKGIASVRFDKRGVAASADAGLKEIDLRFESYVKDVEEWVALLKKESRFSRVDILGHSEGSLIGMIAAQKDKTGKFISVAGVGSPAGVILREQLKEQSPIVLQMALPLLEKMEKGEMVDDVPQAMQSLFRSSVQPYMISWFKYDPQKEIAKLNNPILIVQGTTDIQVSVSDAEKLAKANKKAEKHIIEGMNHILKEAKSDRQQNLQTYSKPDLPLKAGLVDIVALFIKK